MRVVGDNSMPQVIGGRMLLSTAEACQQSRLSQRHIALLLAQKRLEGFKLGRVWHVYADSLEQYLQQPHKTGPKGPRKAHAM
jgi:excisionase family DNA binding protein